jgi:dolichyl-phosphate beta-glucosyltransferase
MALAAAEPYLSVIIPAYNEAQRIAETLSQVRAYLDRQGHDYEVIVAADGDDGTREIVADLAASDQALGERLTVLGSAERGGKGKGIRDGVRRARGQYIGFVDADYKTPIEELDKLLPVLEGGCDVVIGSRAVGDSRIIRPQPLYRRWGSKAFKWIMRAIVGLYGIGDTQCGFKFFQGRVAKDLFARQRIDGYMFDVEILRLARKLGYSIKEVGVRWQDDGDSRYDPIAGTWRNARELLRIRFMQYPPLRRGVVAFPAERATAESDSEAGVRVQKPALTHS